jgi:hypothetical protein
MNRIALLAWLAVILAIACKQGTAGEPLPTVATKPPAQGAPRSFAMGISSFPPALTQASYDATFALGASVGDVILIQRNVPWEEMLAGHPSGATVASTRRETQLAKQYGLRTFVAIDPTDPAQGRAQPASLPPDLAGAGFADPKVQQAFLTYARYIATNYQPDYLALGVEINSYQRAQPQDFERFVQLYHAAYAGVKSISPKTLVFPTFQLEEMQGLLPVDNPQPAQWFLVNRFLPDLDLFAVSTYPTTAYGSLDQLPPAYFAQIASYTDKPIAITSTGYPSQSSDPAATDAAQQQADYLQRVLDSAQPLSMAFVIWFVSQDPSSASDPALTPLQSMGLRAQDGAAKPAWDLWAATARRPWEPPAPTTTPVATP